MSAKKIIFVTGTDTGVGKTLLSALLLFHLRQNGSRALAMKPFCSGGRGDVRLLQSLQPGELSDAEMNPFYFRQPLAPFIAVGKKHNYIRLDNVIERIKQIGEKCEHLVVEGSGGLLVPLGENFTVADLIAKLDCQVLVVARNRLGTINHTALTIKALQSIGIKQDDMAVVLMSARKPDLSAKTNPKFLNQVLHPIKTFSLPFLGLHPVSQPRVRANHTKVRSIVAKLVR
jgi:dethiobiotin synthetase